MRALRWALILAALTGAGYWLVPPNIWGRLLQVNNVVVRGNQRLSTGEVQALLEGLHGHSILTADLGAWRDRLLSSPWVSEASLRRVLPSTVEVSVVERTPLGIGRFGNRLYLVDQRGSVIDEYGPNYADLDLPIIDGLLQASLDGAARPRAALVRRLLDAVRAEGLDARLSQIDITDGRNVVVLLDGDQTLLRLGDDHFVARLRSYLDLAPALRERIPEIDYVDLRFDERVYVRPLSRQPAGPGAGGTQRASPQQGLGRGAEAG